MSGDEEGATVDIFYSIVKFFVEGGPFMLPILLVGAVGTAIAVERYVSLTRMSVKNRNVWSQVEPALASGDFDKARELKTAMQERMTEIMPQLEKRTHYLATLANVATLLGLLGTVSGLISAFAAVATVNPAEKANLLSASISEAMNCTAFGLVTAVPFLVIHALLQTKTTQLIESLESVSIKFLTALTSRQRTVSQGPVELPRAVA
jgi:biopolymer transport protein ExbB